MLETIYVLTTLVQLLNPLFVGASFISLFIVGSFVHDYLTFTTATRCLMVGVNVLSIMMFFVAGISFFRRIRDLKKVKNGTLLPDAVTPARVPIILTVVWIICTILSGVGAAFSFIYAVQCF